MTHSSHIAALAGRGATISRLAYSVGLPQKEQFGGTSEGYFLAFPLGRLFLGGALRAIEAGFLFTAGFGFVTAFGIVFPLAYITINGKNEE
jgi:hypothetical protein